MIILEQPRLGRIGGSAEFPPVTAFVAVHKRGHRFVGTSGLNLVVGTIGLLAFAALQQIGFGSSRNGHLVVVDRFLGELLSELLQFVRRHLFSRHFRQTFWFYAADENSQPEIRVLRVLQIGNSAPNPATVLGIRVIEFVETSALNTFRELVGIDLTAIRQTCSFEGVREHFTVGEKKINILNYSAMDMEIMEFGGAKYVYSY